jgi:hypothetical protein
VKDNFWIVKGYIFEKKVVKKKVKRSGQNKICAKLFSTSSQKKIQKKEIVYQLFVFCFYCRIQSPFDDDLFGNKSFLFCFFLIYLLFIQKKYIVMMLGR